MELKNDMIGDVRLDGQNDNMSIQSVSVFSKSLNYQNER